MEEWETTEEEEDHDQRATGYFLRWHNPADGRERIMANLSIFWGHAPSESETGRTRGDRMTASSARFGWRNMEKHTGWGITSIVAEIYMKISIHEAPARERITVGASVEIPGQNAGREGKNHAGEDKRKGESKRPDERENSEVLYRQIYQTMKGAIRDTRVNGITGGHGIPGNTNLISTPFESRMMKRRRQNAKRRSDNDNRRKTLVGNPTEKIADGPGAAEQTRSSGTRDRHNQPEHAEEEAGKRI